MTDELLIKKLKGQFEIIQIFCETTSASYAEGEIKDAIDEELAVVRKECLAAIELIDSIKK